MRFVRRRNSSISPRVCSEVKVSSTEKILKGRKYLYPIYLSRYSHYCYYIAMNLRGPNIGTHGTGVAIVAPKYVNSARAWPQPGSKPSLHSSNYCCIDIRWSESRGTTQTNSTTKDFCRELEKDPKYVFNFNESLTIQQGLHINCDSTLLTIATIT
jgi:hypothetical protein